MDYFNVITSRDNQQVLQIKAVVCSFQSCDGVTVSKNVQSVMVHSVRDNLR